MQSMQKEMMKAGVIEEMMDDAFEMLDDDETEEQADEEVRLRPLQRTSAQSVQMHLGRCDGEHGNPHC